jgi:hypothetical protein
MRVQNECHHFIENIIGCRADLSNDEVIEILEQIQVIINYFNK